MTTEEQLRDATHAYADPIEPAADAWARIRARLQPARRSRKPIAWAVAAAVVLALAGGVFALVRANDDDQAVETVSPAPPAAMPAEVVAVTADGRVVVLDSASGQEIRTLASNAMSVPDGPSIATDGETVYFTRDSGNRCDSDLDGEPDPISEIARVSVDGGAAERVVTGVRYPALSSDGRYLAYTGVVNCSDGGGSIYLYDLTKHLETIQFDARPPPSFGISRLSWAPNSRDLLFVLGGAPEGGFPRVLDTDSETSLDREPFVLVGDCCGVDAYRGDTGQVLGTYAAAGNDLDQRIRVIAIDPVLAGDVDGPPSEFRELFRFPEPCCGQQFSSDPSGKHILGVSSTGDLYRWTAGDAEPTRISTGVTAAAWVAND